MYIVYTKQDCKWCNLAKAALTEINQPYKELKYLVDFTKEELKELLADYNIITDRITMPQIFFSHPVELEYIGTYEELMEYLKKDRTI